MLSAQRIRNKNYHLQLARDDYYQEGGEAPGQWYGLGAQKLGLSGQVDGERLLRMMEGFHPDGSEKKLVQNAGIERLVYRDRNGILQEKEREIGIDFTFSVPKTFSVEWSQTDDLTRSTMQHILLSALRKTLNEMEAQAQTRRGKGGKKREPVELVVALFPHETARPVDGIVSPQLHVHALILNVGVRSDGTTGTVQLTDLLKQRKLWGALFRAELAHQLGKQLGYQIGEHLQGRADLFDVRGVNAELVDFFSQRRKAIEERLEERGQQGAIAASVAALATREAKGEVPPRAELFRTWREIGKRFGYKSPRPRFSTHNLERLGRETLAEALNDLMTRTDSFCENDLIRAVAERAPRRGLGIDDIKASVRECLNRHEVVPLRPMGGEPHYTTAERRALNQTVRQAETAAEGQTIRIGQRLGVKLSRKGLNAAKKTWDGQGRAIIAVAPGKAALTLKDDTEIPAYTPYRFLGKLRDRHFELTPNTIVALDDERGEISGHVLTRILERIEASDARLVFVGRAPQRERQPQRNVIHPVPKTPRGNARVDRWER